MRYSVLVLIIQLLFAMAASAETRIFDLSHRRAADVADAVRAALDDDAKITAIDRSLVVNAASAQLDVAADLIAKLDRPVRMLRVYVSQDQQVNSNINSGAGSIYASDGGTSVVIGRPATNSPTSGGAKVIIGGDHGMIIGSGQADSRVETHRAEQFLLTLEGSPARISVGQRIPYSEHWLDLAHRHARIAENWRYETVDTGFEVIPMLFAGEQVELSIHPFMAFVDPHREHEIRFHELTTRVRVPLGEWVDLAGTMADQDEVSREILGSVNQRADRVGNVRVRVELPPE